MNGMEQLLAPALPSAELNTGLGGERPWRRKSANGGEVRLI